MKKIFCKVLLINICTIFTFFTVFTVKVKAEENQNKPIGITYNVHVQNDGWEKDFSKKNGDISGTSGRSLRLEGIKIKVENSEDIKVRYKTHVQNVGWQEWKKNGDMSGTTGQSLRLEGVMIELENTSKYSVMYRVHVQNIGWQEWKYDGEMAGTEGKSLRLEAIQIKIVDKVKRGKINIDKDIFSKYYNNENIKLSGWAMASAEENTLKATIDGEEQSLTRIERRDVINSIKGYGDINENPKPGFSLNINTKDLEHGEHTLKLELNANDGSVLKTYSKKFKVDKELHVKYETHVQNIGWQGERTDGNLSGTEGKSLRLEAIRINAINLPNGAKILYKTQVQNIGWQDWKSNGAIAGTSGKSLRLESIRIKLQGADDYAVKYRVHIQNVGWQDWCYDGEIAGTVGESLRLEAIQIKIVKKIDVPDNIKIILDNLGSNVYNIEQTIRGWTMQNISNTKLDILIDDNEIEGLTISRSESKTIVSKNKGYGDEDINNPKPVFTAKIDFSKYSLGTHYISFIIKKDGEVKKELRKEINITDRVKLEEGTYGDSGLKVSGDSRGVKLPYYRYGNGENIFFATFAIHGFEDIWDKDGAELVEIANDFHQKLLSLTNYTIADKWTIYIFPGVNQDGLNHGYTNDGPGRTTLYSEAPGNKGIDLNRCWQIGNDYTKFTSDRNYNGTTGFQAYEAKALRTFMLNHKSKNGQTVLVDLHGWTQQLIGDPDICAKYQKYFPENDRSAVGRYGTGYLVNWARTYLGSSKKNAKAALIELPNTGINGHQSVVNKNLSSRYIESTLEMLRSI